ncbi:RMD1 family protein [Sulfurimonas marina]|uniref:RMD1 family protein n=1 Tax=Sulfurimonas marina TaxID=2590551 RepID=A0A7M1AVW4_9BACT|nr:RMD1 family protein [Sulfurimonas marina]QOP40728.1 RMD1 family protein [Sulfurimonas marina]
MQKKINSFVVSDKFDTKIYQFLSGKYKTTLYKDILFVTVDVEQYIVLFKYGVYTCWNISYENLEFFQNEIKSFLINPLEECAEEKFKYILEDEFKIIYDKFLLDNDSERLKIAISSALAQNAKLSQFETKVENTIEENSIIPQNLAKYGKISLSKKEIAKKIGELFLVKSQINLQYDLLDTPEFFWEYPEYEKYYNSISKYLDITPRVEVLNKKVEVIQELLDVLSNEQNHKYSSFLEWIIIILIFIEIIMGLYEFLK